MASLAFRLLDAQVIAGRADEPAVVHDSYTCTYAQLLHDSAGLAAGLRICGLSPGSALTVDCDDPQVAVVTLLACIRLGVWIVPDAPARVVGEPAMIEFADLRENWHVVLKAGRADPLPAAEQDPPGFAESMLANHPGPLQVWLDGGYFTPQA